MSNTLIGDNPISLRGVFLEKPNEKRTPMPTACRLSLSAQKLRKIWVCCMRTMVTLDDFTPEP